MAKAGEKKAVRKLIKEIRAAGYKVGAARSGGAHAAVYDSGGRQVARISTNPSGLNAVMRMRRELIRAGVPVRREG